MSTIKSRLYDLVSGKQLEQLESAPSVLYTKLVESARLARITVNTFARNRMGFQCVSLSYFMAIALIPFIAFVFAVTGGLGIEDKLTRLIYSILPSNYEYATTILDKAHNIIDTTKSGIVGFFSGLMFIWSILWMMFQVERVFNNVWGVRKIPRNIFKRFGIYIVFLILSPFILIIFGSGIVIYSKVPMLVGINFSSLRFIWKILGYVVFYIITTFTLSAMYKFIPAPEVDYKLALKSAAMTAVVFVLFQYLYLRTQIFVGRLDVVYGVLAAIPLFLIWLNFSWQIIIYGAELCYGFHNMDKYKIPDWDSENRE